MSRGKVLGRVYELREEVEVFLMNEGSDYAKLLASDERCARLAYLEDILHHLNELNTQIQGRNKNVLTSTNKISGFRLKVHLWQQHVIPLIRKWKNVHTAALCKVIGKHLKTIDEKILFYFSSALTECLYRVMTELEIHTAQQLLERT